MRKLSPGEVVGFYQSLGFFQAQSAEEVLSTYERDYGKPFAGDSPWDDVYLLSNDRQRVWADDPECDCWQGEYTRFLTELSAISEGTFVPEGISETWKSDEGPIRVRFVLDDVEHSVEPEWHYDWLDLAILDPINAMISPTGRRFALAADVNHAVIVCVSPQTIDLMRKTRQYPFMIPPKTLW